MKTPLFIRYLLMTIGFGMLCACGTASNITSHTTSERIRHPFIESVLARWPLLSPSLWGQDISVQQLLTIQAGGEQHQVQAALDISHQTVHLVILKFGRRLVTIEHTDTQTQVDKEAYVPEFIDARQVLQDMQLVYAPLTTLQSILPEQCRIFTQPLADDREAEQRTVQCSGQMIYQIDSRTVNGLRSTRLNNMRVPYTIQIDTMQVQP